MMYKCEHCGTEFEGRFCPNCGELFHDRKSGKQAMEIPKAFQNWQITLLVLAVAAAAALLLGGVWYIKDSTDQAIAELNLTRLDNMYLQTPGGQTQGQNPEQNAGGTTGGNAGETNQEPAANASSAPAQNEGNTGAQPTDPAPEQPSGDNSVSHQEIPVPDETKNPDPAVPIGSLTVADTLSGSDLAKVFDSPLGYYGQKVRLQGTISGWVSGFNGGECLEVSVSVNGQERMVGVYAQENEYYIPQGATVTIQGDVVGVGDTSYNGYDVLEVQTTESIDVALTDGENTILRENNRQDSFRFEDSPEFSDLTVTVNRRVYMTDTITYYVTIDNPSDTAYIANTKSSCNSSAIVYRYDLPSMMRSIPIIESTLPESIPPHSSQTCKFVIDNQIDFSEMKYLQVDVMMGLAERPDDPDSVQFYTLLDPTAFGY